MDDLSLPPLTAPPGFRLHKLEVSNWGTFDSTTGDIHTVRPNGQTTLLIGQNASGKSTLVDALLTLLVRPGVRNYNVAAGAHKQERDERSYIKGACGRLSRDDDNRAEVQFLRPSGRHYSVLLACFRNEGTGQVFSVAEILYLTAEGHTEKVYCFANDERSIAADCAGLTSMEKLRQQMVRRGFRATASFTEYHSWFVRATGVQSKAMDIFNQTVAVKDIQSLNRFIRDHMLEAKSWNDRVESLLGHFTQLSDAHKSLMAVRRQYDLLLPIAEKGDAYRIRAERSQQLTCLLAAADSFFRQKTLELFVPECEARRLDLAALRAKKEKLETEMTEALDECSRLKNAIDQAGGERLQQIPQLIKNHQLQADQKREAHRRYLDALRTAGIKEAAQNAASFADVQKRIAPLQRELDAEITEHDRQRTEQSVERARVSQTLREDESELKALLQRQGNLPEYLARLRRQICEDLRLPERDLPFVAELVAVRPEERAWESSIEMVLRSFALSLLVPARHYQLVSRHVDQTRLQDAAGRGQRLVYLRVGERAKSSAGPVPHPHSLLRKLAFRDNHPLMPWVKGELEERFDYRCCDTLAEFQEAQELALTAQRHVKIRGVRHEKDDRERVADPRYFVLGWDNREKCRRLGEVIRRSQEELGRLDQHLTRLDQQLKALRDRQTAASRALEVTDFGALDHAFHENEIKSLRWEQQQLEENNEAVRPLKKRLAAAESCHKGLQASRDDVIGTIRDQERDLQSGERLIEAAKKQIRVRKTDGTFTLHAESFETLERYFAEDPLTAPTLLDREQAFLKARNAEIDVIRQEVEPLKTELGTLMNRFLREFPDERADLEGDVRYLGDFLDLLEHIRREDLPRHEQRFKERLNEKVTQEVGLFNGALQTDCREIVDKIDVLNASLRQVEYRPGTYMRLEPRSVRDPDIADFQDSLRQCLAGTFEGTLEADEARYLRIEKLLTRLRDEQRWREKVTDVRRWFDFAARELDLATEVERGYYEDSTGQSGGEKAKLAFTILVAAIAYQYDITPGRAVSDRFHFVVVDEMFSKVDDQFSEYALNLFRKFGLQLLIVAPLDAKARVTEPHVGCYLHVVKDVQTSASEIFSMTAHEFEETLAEARPEQASKAAAISRRLPR